MFLRALLLLEAAPSLSSNLPESVEYSQRALTFHRHLYIYLYISIPISPSLHLYLYISISLYLYISIFTSLSSHFSRLPLPAQVNNHLKAVQKFGERSRRYVTFIEEENTIGQK